MKPEKPEIPAEFTKYITAAVWMPPAKLRAWDANPRVNEGKPTQKVMESLQTFGFVAPICIWTSKKRLVAGHTRLAAYAALVAEDPDFTLHGAPAKGLVPVRFHEFRSEEEADAYAIADNRLGELAEWDPRKLADAVARIRAADEKLVVATGYEERDLAAIVAKIRAENAPKGDPDDVPEPPEAITKPGDLWLLGEHRLLCGDAQDAKAVARVVGEDSIALLWTDPPYNVEVVAGAGSGPLGRGMPAEERKAKGCKTIVNDEMDDASFRALLAAAFKNADTVMRPGAAFYIAHADSEGFNFRGAVRDLGWKFTQCIVWVKDSFVMGRQDYHWRHEPILYGWKEGAGHHVLSDRTQDTVWEYGRPPRSVDHPTMKPVELVERAVANSTDHGECVLDPFGGSGSTLIACERRERRARLLEIDPHYCDVIVARWEAYTGRKATRQERPAKALNGAAKAKPARKRKVNPVVNP